MALCLLLTCRKSEIAPASSQETKSYELQWKANGAFRQAAADALSQFIL